MHPVRKSDGDGRDDAQAIHRTNQHLLPALLLMINQLKLHTHSNPAATLASAAALRVRTPSPATARLRILKISIVCPVLHLS
jgi:hypothetical protein